MVGTAKDKWRYFVHGTTLRTEKPAESAASASRWSPQMKLLLDGRCSHQFNDAASCTLSAARKEYLSSDCVAKSRSWSSGRTSLHHKRRRATAPCLSRSVISLSRWRRQMKKTYQTISALHFEDLVRQLIYDFRTLENAGGYRSKWFDDENVRCGITTRYPGRGMYVLSAREFSSFPPLKKTPV